MKFQGHKNYPGVIEDTRIAALKQDLYSLFEGKSLDDPQNPVGVQVTLRDKRRDFGFVTGYDGIYLHVRVIGIGSGLANNSVFYLEDIERVTPLDELTTENLRQLAEKNSSRSEEIRFRNISRLKDLESEVALKNI